MKTRAAILTEFERPQPYARSRPISVEQVDLDEPSQGEVLVRIVSAGVCHSDLSTVIGTLRKPLPLVLGHEAAGVVEAVGPGVTALKPGDKVVFSFVPSCGRCGPCASGRPALCEPGNRANAAGALLRDGRRLHRGGEPLSHHLGVSGFSEYAVAAEESLVRVADDVPLEIAAVFGCAALTGLGAVIHAARVLPGTSVAIFGAGGVGLMALLGALLVGASNVFVVDPVESKRKIALELGATDAFGPEGGDVVDRLKDLCGGRGCDYVIEASGVVPAFEHGALSLAPGGTMVAVGIPRAAEKAQLSPAFLVGGDRTIRGAFMSSSVPSRDIPRYVDLWRAKKLPVEKLISGTVGLDRVNEAMDALASGEALRTLILP